MGSADCRATPAESWAERPLASYDEAGNQRRERRSPVGPNVAPDSLATDNVGILHETGMSSADLDESDPDLFDACLARNDP